MKHKKLIISLCLFVAIVFGVLIWWYSSYTMTNIAPSEVSKIEIFNGNSGVLITIIDSSDIKHIIDNLNSIPLKKAKISIGYMGYSFRTTIYKTNGDVYKEFIINSKDTIRKDPFFYRDSSNSIDYDYIEAMFYDKK